MGSGKDGSRRDEPGWRLDVDAASDGMRLDRFVAMRIPRLSRARAARLEIVDIDDQRRLKKSASVRNGQRLWVRRPVPDPDVTVPTPTVIFEDERFVVLNKPAGLAAHPSASRFRATVTYWLSGEPRFADTKLAHRIDVETSGVLVCVRPPVERLVGRLFAEHRVTKTYVAVVEGVPREDEWVIDAALGFDPHSRISIKMSHGNLSAQTKFVVRHRGPRRCVVEAYPVTGRQHQIRVHLQMSGHPIVGDKLYGPDERLFVLAKERALTPDEYAVLGHHRHALHAQRIRLPLPEGEVTFETAVPDEFQTLADD